MVVQPKRQGHKLETQVPSEKAGRTKGMETKVGGLDVDLLAFIFLIGFFKKIDWFCGGSVLFVGLCSL